MTEQELTDAEKELIIRDLPGLAQETDANYYLIIVQLLAQHLLHRQVRLKFCQILAL